MADLVVLDSDAPVSPSPGQIWIQTSTGQVWAYINSQWSPITGGDPFDFDAPVSVFISGIKRDDKIQGNSLKINNKITEQVDTCSFLMYDDGDSSVRPQVGEQIDIFEYLTTKKVFGGEISKITQQQVCPGIYRFQYNVQCTDFSKRMHRKLVTETYSSMNAGNIIKDLIDTYATEFSYANVETGPVIDSISFNYKPLDECIKKIAKLVGYQWYVDYIKDVHFFLPSTEYAPYSLSENPTTSGHHKELQISVDKSRYRNKIYLVGGYRIVAVNDDIQVADGQRTNFNVAFEPYSTVRAYVDTGGGFVEKTVGRDNIDTSGYDFVYNQTEKVLKNLDLAKLSNGHILKITYYKKEKLVVYDEDATSIATIKAIEGGDGIYEYKLEDDTIETLEEAQDRIDAELRDYKDPIIQGTFKSDQSGYKAGQILQINLPSWGYASKEYEIHSVTTHIKSGVGDNFKSYVEYTIQFATILRGFYEFLRDMYSNSTGKEVVIKGDETITT